MATPYGRGTFNPNPGGQGGPENNYSGTLGTNPGPTWATYDATAWGGRKEDVFFDPKTGQFVPIEGSSGEGQDVNRYRGMAQAPGQAAPTVQVNDGVSSGAMGDAIGRLDDAASGRVSQGADLVRSQTMDARRGLTSTAASVRGGPGARVAAARYANRAGMERMAIGNRQAEAVKAGEMADARGAHMAATTAQRGQDLDIAGEDARQRQAQRARDAEREAAYEKLAWETRNAALGARLKRSAAQQQQSLGQKRFEMEDASSERQHTGEWVRAGSGAAAGAAGGFAAGGSGGDSGGDDPWDDDTTSDERAKIMYSPAEAKNPATLEDAIAQGREDADPYKRPTGATGAPQGYAAMRDGQAGSMFGNAPQVMSGYEKPGAVEAMNAPGTSDWARYGEPAKHDRKTVDWKHGGATTKRGQKPAQFGSLAMFLRPQSNDLMYSDDKTKLAAAYEAGKAAAPKKPEIGAKITEAVKGATGEDAKKLRDIAIAAGGRIAMSPAAAPNNFVDEAGDQLKMTAEAKPADARAAMPGATAAEYVAPALAGPIGGAVITRYMRSDEKAKDAIDLDATSMRDGSSDPRTNSFDKTFRRDTKADQKRVKKGVEDKASKDADDMMASFGASLKKGPTARIEDVDSDEKPDLSAAADAAKGAIPNGAMYSAMKAMQPSLYSYKPEFTPPEQHVGEVQAGPMANKMKKNPIAGLAIEENTPTGLLAIDKDKALKLTMGSLAVLARDVEEMKRKKGVA